MLRDVTATTDNQWRGRVPVGAPVVKADVTEAIRQVHQG
jgi:hypothetical protein